MEGILSVVGMGMVILRVRVMVIVQRRGRRWRGVLRKSKKGLVRLSYVVKNLRTIIG